MTILQMRYFLTVCRLQNITHAAAELHLAQSTLSQAMQTIEEETGLNLFLRSGRTIRISHEEGSHGCTGQHHFVPVRQFVEFLPGFRTAQDDLVSRG